MTEMTTPQQTLADWCAWLRNDLAYRAPEQWPGVIARWLRSTEQRFGERPEREAMPDDLIDRLEALVGDMACGLACGGNDDENLADYLARLRPLVAALGVSA